MSAVIPNSNPLKQPNLSELSQRLGYLFKDETLILLALTHRSTQQKNHNERLEFLGDAVLGLIIGEILYRKFPEASEGQLSHLRTLLVRGETLSAIADSFELGEFMLLGQGERQSGGRSRRSILENTLEAVIGAIYLDSDLSTCGHVIAPWFAHHLSTLKLTSDIRDAKSLLQEHLQSRRLELPEYRIAETTGALHDQTFSIECHVAAMNIRTLGVGKSRKKAEQHAAELALREILDQPAG